jgi:hypothetical protein
MADIFQGDVLPSITSTAQAQTTAPEFYTNYLQDVANLGQAGVQMGGVAGMSPLQQQALSMAPQASFAGLGTMGMGADLAAQSGTTTAPQMVGQYMNPYTQNVVEEMGRLQGRQINENLLPAMQGAAGGMGQFGSQRQFNATGNMLRDMQSNLIGQQYGALNTGLRMAVIWAPQGPKWTGPNGEVSPTDLGPITAGAQPGTILTADPVAVNAGEDPRAAPTFRLERGSLPQGLTVQKVGDQWQISGTVNQADYTENTVIKFTLAAVNQEDTGYSLKDFFFTYVI